MAITATVVRDELSGRRRVKEGVITFDASYPAGGEAFDPALIGLTRIDFLAFNQGEDGFVFHWDAANEKIIVFESGTASAGLDEQDAATDLSGVTVEYQATGI